MTDPTVPTKPEWLGPDVDETDPAYLEIRTMALFVADKTPDKGPVIEAFKSMVHMVMIALRWGREMMPVVGPELHVLWMGFDDNSGLLYVAPQPPGEAPCSREERAYLYFKRIHDARETPPGGTT